MTKSIDAQIRDINKELNSLVGKSEQARTHALMKLGRWAQGRLLKLCRKKFHIEPHTRVALSKKQNFQVVNVHVDMRRIYVKILKNAYQAPRGVRFDHEFYPHAFIANVGNYYMPRVYRRLTKARFPLERIYIEIGFYKRWELGRLAPELFKEFYKCFGQTLGNNFQLTMDCGREELENREMWG